MSIQRDFVRMITKAGEKKVKGYDTQATVVRVEDNTVWVHIPGGIDETPIRKTIAARVGDVISIRVAGGRAWITGNESAPPTDDAAALYATGVAVNADTTAMNAGKKAIAAQETAEGAQLEAEGAASNASDLRDEYNDYTEGLEDELEQMQGYIDGISQDMEDGFSEVSSAIAEQVAALNDADNILRDTINGVDVQYATSFSQLYQFIRFITDNQTFNGIELGPAGEQGESRIQLRVGTATIDGETKNVISFAKDGENLGYWDGINLYTGNIVVEVSQRAQFGNFAFIPRSDGSLSFLRVV